jgi:hypothetical protein
MIRDRRFQKTDGKPLLTQQQAVRRHDVCVRALARGLSRLRRISTT